MEDIRFESLAIREILQKDNLNIPSYQRPYKWTKKNIRNLFYDIRDVKGNQEYPIGSLILHSHEGKLDIVDGQQRLISISLLIYALNQVDDFKGAKSLFDQEYGEISRQHAQENFQEWQILLKSISENDVEIFRDAVLNNCTVSVITMPNDRLSEAFQLFDSQNNRGKSLAPHDLLKAYHLRTIDLVDEDVVRKWEEFVDDDELSLQELFDKHLFRMRRWSNGETGLTKRRYGSYLRFTEDFIDDFKGVEIDNNYPYLSLYKELKKGGIDFPKSYTMPVINGEQFFKYIEYSHEHLKTIQEQLTKQAVDKRIIERLSSKERRYSRNQNLYFNIFALFVDRFGEENVTIEVVDKLFVWAFYPRRKAKAIYDSTLANYAAGGTFQHRPVQKLFQVLASSTSPNNFLMKIDTDVFDEKFNTVEKILEAEE